MGLKRMTACGAVLVSALVSVACSEPTPTAKLPQTSAASSGSSTAASPTSDATTTTSAAPTVTYTPEEQAVIDQYKGYSDAFYSVPDLSEATVRAAFESYTTAEGLDQVVGIFRQMTAKGHRPGGKIVYGTIAVSIAGTDASITECRDGSTETTVSTVDGTILGRGGPGTKVEANLILSDDQRWLVIYTHGTAAGC